MTEHALTKKQLEALRALHHGEVALVLTHGARYRKWMLMPSSDNQTPVDITGRVMALCKKRMCRYMTVDANSLGIRPLVLTPRGEEELAKFPEV